MDWRFDIQWRFLFSHIMYPDTDRELNILRCSGGLDGSGFYASWGPQLALVSAYSFFGGSEKLRKANISFDCRVVNAIPRDLHTLIYFAT